MDKKAQAGLEYLMTYGWALIMVAAIIGALVLLVAAPSEQPAFSSTSPGKLLVKGSSFSQGSATIKLQNITGGTIKITSFAGFGGGMCTINSIQSGVEVSIGPGGELLIVCNDPATDYSTPLSIQYTDQADLTQSVDITPINVPESKCGNGILDTGEECDTLGNLDVPVITGLSCRPGCRGIDISQCTGGNTLSQPKTYYLKNDLTAAANCIKISAGTLDCDNKTINLGPLNSWTGIDITGPATAKNCTIIGTARNQKGINMSSAGAVVIENNTISLGSDGSMGMYLNADLSQTIVSGNNTTASKCGISFRTSTAPPQNTNSCGKCSQPPATGYCDKLCGIGPWNGTSGWDPCT